MTVPFLHIAHLGPLELFTPELERSAWFFRDLLGMDVTGESDDTLYLHAWDDYLPFTIKLTARERPGIGTTYLRARNREAIQDILNELHDRGIEVTTQETEHGLGPVHHFTDPDGHDFGIFFDCEKYHATEQTRPSLKNQAARFPGAPINARRLDHLNLLAADVTANSDFTHEVLGGKATEQIQLDSGKVAGRWFTFGQKTYDLVYTEDWTGGNGRLHHLAFATDTREDILRAADVCLEQGVFIETGPHKHAVQQTFFLYVYEPGGNRIEFCNAGARLTLAPDKELITWTETERMKGQAWGLKTIDSFHTHGTP